MTDFRYDYLVEMYHGTLSVIVLDRFENVPDFHESLVSLGIPIAEDEAEADKDLFPCRALTWPLPFEPGQEPYDGASLARVVVVITRSTDIELLAHEATHAALFFAIWHGFPVSVKAELQEPLSYMVGHLTGCLQHAQQDAVDSQRKRRG